MADKYHTEWTYRDFATGLRIFKAQERTFKFLSSMAYDLDDAIGMLEGIEQLPALGLQLELMKQKLYYLEKANEIGRLFEKNRPKGASGA